MGTELVRIVREIRQSLDRIERQGAVVCTLLETFTDAYLAEKEAREEVRATLRAPEKREGPPSPIVRVLARPVRTSGPPDPVVHLIPRPPA